MTDRIPLQIVADKSRRFPRVVSPVVTGPDYAMMADHAIGIRLMETRRDLFGTGYPYQPGWRSPVGISGERFVVHDRGRWVFHYRGHVERCRTITEAVAARETYFAGHDLIGFADAA